LRFPPGVAKLERECCDPLDLAAFVGGIAVRKLRVHDAVIIAF